MTDAVREALGGLEQAVTRYAEANARYGTGYQETITAWNDVCHHTRMARAALANDGLPNAETLAERMHHLCGDWDENWRDGDWLQLADAALKAIRALKEGNTP